MPPSDAPVALAFDTGGTIFDWHTAVAATLAEIGADRGVQADWFAVTKAWRRLSTTMVDRDMPEQDGRATIDMDGVLRVTLDAALAQEGVDGLDDEDRARAVLGWRTMRAWPDVPVGLRRLRSRFVVAPFTILKAALVIESSRLSGISWDAIISCEMIGVYKTRLPSYQAMARWLDLPHERIMMVTTHNNDLNAAHEYGFRTAFVERQHEWSDIPSPDPVASEHAEFTAHDLNDLADQLGCGPDPLGSAARGAIR